MHRLGVLVPMCTTTRAAEFNLNLWSACASAKGGREGGWPRSGGGCRWAAGVTGAFTAGPCISLETLLDREERSGTLFGRSAGVALRYK